MKTAASSHTRPGPAPDAAPPGKNFGQTVLDDLHQADLPHALKQDFKEIYRFYLDSETRRALDGMGRGQRWLFLTGWLLKSSILKLTPNRRLMLLLGGVSVLLGLFGFIGYVWGFGLALVILMLVLLLELKDKLLAQDELEAGRAVQFALMPDEHPSLPGWQSWIFTRPANEVGGDLVDYLRLDGARLGLVLGDVAGKGLGAALVMAKLQATLRALAPDHRAFGSLGARLNRVFCSDGLPSCFVSMAYLEVEPGKGDVRLLNAGHLPPLVVRPGSLEQPTKGAPALGLKADAGYDEQTLHLDAGDLLVVYSDGLTEARAEDGTFFGDDRLRLMLPHLRDLDVAEAGRLILSELDRFVGDARPHDDLSLILLKRLDDPEPSALPSPSVSGDGWARR